MTETPRSRSRDLSSDEREDLAAAVRAARAEGQTRWVACVRAVPAIDVLAGYEGVTDRDRFYWERAASGLRFFGFGRADEIESAGRERFRDVEGWAAQVRERIHWIGAPRPARAPLFLGGFGFEDSAPPESQWKAFPAARFILPAVLGEVAGDVARWIVFVRVEPGSTVEQIEAAIAERWVAAGATVEGAEDAAGERRSDDPKLADWVHETIDADSGLASGPSYKVQSDRAHAVFEAQVAAALREIEVGTFEKVVLARSLRVDHEGRLGIAAFLARLRESYPSCTFFAMGRGEDTFLAATPETLVRLEGDCVSTAALAGSAPRGRTPEEDEALADALFSSDKERMEHAHVVSAIREVLGPMCRELSEQRSPEIRKLFGIQHLETRIEGRLHAPAQADEALSAGASERSGAQVNVASRVSPFADGSTSPAPSILPIVAALHPTPAVCGSPRESARRWLQRVEGLERGWYAAPVGWLDGAGGGDFSVALRSALIQNATPSRAWLFAGAGIVEGSEPSAELIETRIKLRALLAPLTEI